MLRGGTSPWPRGARAGHAGTRPDPPGGGAARCTGHGAAPGPVSQWELGLLGAVDAPALLAFRNVDIAYGHVQVVFDLGFDVRREETVALLGTNGAGKSTVLRAASGLLTPARGRIWFDGADITGLPGTPGCRARGLVHVPGGRSVFPSLTVAENLRMGAHGSIVATRRSCDAIEPRSLFPGLRARLREPARRSGGQQQMLRSRWHCSSSPRCCSSTSSPRARHWSSTRFYAYRAAPRRGRDHRARGAVGDHSRSTRRTALFLDQGRAAYRGPTAQLFDHPEVLRSVFIAPATEATVPDSAAVAVPAPARARRPPRTHGPPRRGGAPAVRGVAALDGVTLGARQGEILGLVGPNGVRKTTLFDVISGFVAPDTGSVQLGGLDVTSWRPVQLRRLGLARRSRTRLFPSLTVHQAVSVALDRPLRIGDPVPAALWWPTVAPSAGSARKWTS